MTERLLRMAEDILAHLSHVGDDDAVSAAVRAHLDQFWDPAMRAALRADVAAGAQLDPRLARAVLTPPPTQPPPRTA